MTDRPARPTVSQIRQVCQPPSIRGRRNAEHWVADAYQRNISPYLTRLLLRTSITANGVTWLMIATGTLAALAIAIPGLVGGVLAMLLGQMQMLWDCSDGEVARWRKTSSPKGVFLDRIGHYTTETLIPITLGLRAAGFPHGAWVHSSWTLIGLVLSILVLYNKALNDMVHASRAHNEMPKLQDRAEVAVPASSGLRKVRSAARFFPFHRSFHSVEMTIMVFVFAVLDAVAGSLTPTRILLGALTCFAIITVPGHLADPALWGRDLDDGNTARCVEACSRISPCAAAGHL